MKVIWQSNAIRQRNYTAEYIRREFGEKRKTHFLQKVRQLTQQLKLSPYIGKIDPLFAERTASYRSVVINGLNKLVYRVDEDTIHIVAFWDTRMEPETQAEMAK